MNTREEELEIIIEEIETSIIQYAKEIGDIDIDNDYEWMEREFFKEVRRHIKQKEPGWELLLTEYGDEVF